MTNATINVSEDRLLELAGQAASRMKQASEGKDAKHVTRSDAGSIGAVAAMLETLVAALVERRAEDRRRTTALERIANLRVRSAVELLEKRDWKKLSAELQAIAEEALAPGHASRSR